MLVRYPDGITAVMSVVCPEANEHRFDGRGGNVLVTDQGLIKVADFGIGGLAARRALDDAGSRTPPLRL